MERRIPRSSRLARWVPGRSQNHSNFVHRHTRHRTSSVPVTGAPAFVAVSEHALLRTNVFRRACSAALPSRLGDSANSDLNTSRQTKLSLSNSLRASGLYTFIPLLFWSQPHKTLCQFEICTRWGYGNCPLSDTRCCYRCSLHLYQQKALNLS